MDPFIDTQAVGLIERKRRKWRVLPSMHWAVLSYLLPRSNTWRLAAFRLWWFRSTESALGLFTPPLPLYTGHSPQEKVSLYAPNCKPEFSNVAFQAFEHHRQSPTTSNR